mgnify:CR=1 FL=1
MTREEFANTIGCIVKAARHAGSLCEARLWYIEEDIGGAQTRTQIESCERGEREQDVVIVDITERLLVWFDDGTPTGSDDEGYDL